MAIASYLVVLGSCRIQLLTTLFFYHHGQCFSAELGEASDVLHLVRVAFVDTTFCVNNYNHWQRHVQITDNQFCAGTGFQ